VRVGWTVEYLAGAASSILRVLAEKHARAAGLVRIRGLLGVVVYPASLALGGAEGAEVDAHGSTSITFIRVSDRGAARHASEE